jgi:hypothetical protein
MSYAQFIQPSPGIAVTRSVAAAPTGGVIRIARVALELSASVLARFTGLRIIPDVHGAFDAFDRAVTEAESDNRFVLQLGDLIDRGEYSPLCVGLMLELEQRGVGQMLLGNHEYKFARFVRFGTNATPGRTATLDQFIDYGPKLLDPFIARVEEGPLWIRMGSWFFVHGGFDPRMLEVRSWEEAQPVIDIALYGADGGSRRRVRQPASIQEWVDRIPAGLTVVVGHVITLSRQIECREGKAGGRVIFLETGGWRDPNGVLATLDIPFE